MTNIVGLTSTTIDTNGEKRLETQLFFGLPITITDKNKGICKVSNVSNITIVTSIISGDNKFPYQTIVIGKGVDGDCFDRKSSEQNYKDNHFKIVNELQKIYLEQHE